MKDGQMDRERKKAMKVRTSSCEERGHLGTMRYMRKPLLKGH
jgi:hypothetical protein